MLNQSQKPVRLGAAGQDRRKETFPLLLPKKQHGLLTVPGLFCSLLVNLQLPLCTVCLFWGTQQPCAKQGPARGENPSGCPGGAGTGNAAHLPTPEIISKRKLVLNSAGLHLYTTKSPSSLQRFAIFVQWISLETNPQI